MIRKLASALIFCLLALTPNPSWGSKKPVDESESGIVYGKDFAFIISAPRGWVMDTRKPVAQNIYAVFYPKGSSWDNGISVMYITLRIKDHARKETLESVINNDIRNQKADSPRLRVKSAPTLPTAGHKLATVKLFSGDANGNHEAVAYVDEKDCVVVLVLTSRDNSHYDAAFPAFRRLVASYIWVTSHVSAPGNRPRKTP